MQSFTNEGGKLIVVLSEKYWQTPVSGLSCSLSSALVCPACKAHAQRSTARFCDECGQRLHVEAAGDVDETAQVYNIIWRAVRVCDVVGSASENWKRKLLGQVGREEGSLGDGGVGGTRRQMASEAQAPARPPRGGGQSNEQPPISGIPRPDR